MRKVAQVYFRSLKRPLRPDPRLQRNDVKAKVGTTPREMGAGQTRVLAHLACEQATGFLQKVNKLRKWRSCRRDRGIASTLVECALLVVLSRTKLFDGRDTLKAKSIMKIVFTECQNEL